MFSPWSCDVVLAPLWDAWMRQANKTLGWSDRHHQLNMHTSKPSSSNRWVGGRLWFPSSPLFAFSSNHWIFLGVLAECVCRPTDDDGLSFVWLPPDHASCPRDVSIDKTRCEAGWFFGLKFKAEVKSRPGGNFDFLTSPPIECTGSGIIIIIQGDRSDSGRLLDILTHCLALDRKISEQPKRLASHSHILSISKVSTSECPWHSTVDKNSTRRSQNYRFENSRARVQIDRLSGCVQPETRKPHWDT